MEVGTGLERTPEHTEHYAVSWRATTVKETMGTAGTEVQGNDTDRVTRGCWGWRWGKLSLLIHHSVDPFYNPRCDEFL